MGCGVGNALFPIKEKYPQLKLFGFDFAKTAIDLLKKSQKYDETSMRVEVCDLVKD
jgi:methyltransferase-like protein 6